MADIAGTIARRKNQDYRPCPAKVENLSKSMSDTRPLYGEDVAALRKKAGFTQQQLADRWGLSRAQIGRYEKTGQIVPPKVADAYRGLAVVGG